jgi:hypothetical protein
MRYLWLVLKTPRPLMMQLDQLLGKQEKMGKVVTRVKFLLEKEEGERASPTNSKVGKVTYKTYQLHN